MDIWWRLGAVQYKHWASSGFLLCSSMNVTGPCLHHYIMCQLIRAQLSCFTNGCSIYVCVSRHERHYTRKGIMPGAASRHKSWLLLLGSRSCTFMNYGDSNNINIRDFTTLTRFNKICHPSQRPRWQVDKEAIGLSRVQQCSSTYNPPSWDMCQPCF